MFEFHISRQSRDRYKFDLSMFAYDGNAILANFHAARLFAQKMNQQRDLVNFPEQTVRAGQINAMGLIDEILHHVVGLFRQQKNPKVMIQALAWLENQFGPKELDKVLGQFNVEFPPVSVYRREMTSEEYLSGQTDGVPNRALVLEELLLLWVSNKNPALDPYLELFSDDRLARETAYPHLMRELYTFFDQQPRFGPNNQNLVDMLRAPAIANPYSLTAQLEFIRTRWLDVLGQYLYRLLTSLDLVKEEEKLSFSGPGPVPIPVYGFGSEAEVERFTADKEWMPRLVLMAKNSYVWLDQLSRKYQRPINHLDQIPDDELDNLAHWGFTGLWLIGLWERSRASARIKQLCGNPEAISSAYSLSSYNIAWDLGGEAAFNNLRERAWVRGIRLASDMVPNHMGIDSSWMVEHPDWFISLDYSPFPSYSYNGPDLSNDGRVGIFLEDHYYDRTDAAVVFKRVDNSSGYTQYVYHGNDGTSMPWNDTAQLNYLNPTVREALIQTILEVARKFPIIRFDAAMTLAKKHLQRLWYPEPGCGGAIPSRAEHSLTREEFEAAIPIEFWREVVDRAAVEAPDTLLLAEAFWLMEGFFVRTLGMHRVYNSAFMNLLRNEDNAKYRTVMKNTLEFDPEILRRFVNFMNNPDERTAVDQFGKGDKYFGICLMLATLPGLPMFGHGQIEGFSEKYGMEFRHANWDEQVDSYLVERHQREIFPILHRRSLFAGVENFLLYDFFTPEGSVNEDVFAYSNGMGDDHTLVVYHNKFAETRGWIRTSVGFSVKSGDNRVVVQRTLGEGLNLHPDDDIFIIFRDAIKNLEYIRPSCELGEQGLYLELSAYKYYAFLDFHQVKDDAWDSYRHLCNYLGGGGVPNIQEALKELFLVPVLTPFRQIANPGYFSYLLSSKLSKETPKLPAGLLDEAVKKMSNLVDGIIFLTGNQPDKPAFLAETRRYIEVLLDLQILGERFPLPGGKTYQAMLNFLAQGLENKARWLALAGWSFVHHLGKLMVGEDFEFQSLTWLDEWQFNKVLAKTYQSMGQDWPSSNWLISTIRMLVDQQSWYARLGHLPLKEVVTHWLGDEEVVRFLAINRHKDVLWYNKESFEQFVWWMVTLAILDAASSPTATADVVIEQALGAYEIAQKLLKAEKTSAFQVQKLIDATGK
ncbi:MAG TPA: alpha-amylase family glycosyl hydrolase [Anaerolineaceae bacterium]